MLQTIPERLRPKLLTATIGAVLLVLVAATGAVTGAFSGGAAQAASTLLSQGKLATASSAENGSFPASAAVDGDTGTRWSSAFSDPQWLQVDLGAPATITSVTLTWRPRTGSPSRSRPRPTA